MFLLTNQINLYGRKVITDLALRSGSATQNDYSRTQGLNGTYSYWLGESRWTGDEYSIEYKTLADTETLLQGQVDFDADIIQPHQPDLQDWDNNEDEEFEKGSKYSPSKDTQQFNEYFRRLEDIRSEYLEKYLGQIIYTLKRTGSNGIVSFENRHRIQPTLGADDAGNITELADLQLQDDKGSVPESVKSRALEQLPYVVKRLHNLSKYCGVHMLSYIAAYEIAKTENRLANERGANRQLARNAVINVGAYKCSPQGYIGTRIYAENKNKYADQMFKWMNGTCNDYPAYKEDYMNFVYYCKILNIKMSVEDFKLFDETRVSKLVCVTLTPNTQYNRAVYDTILNSGMSEQKETVVEDLLYETMNTFRTLVVSNKEIRDVTQNMTHSLAKEIRDNAQLLDFYYNTVILQNPIPRKAELYRWYDGILYYDHEPVILNTDLIGNSVFAEPKFVITELGYCVHLSSEMFLYVLNVLAAADNLKAKYISHTPEDIQEWRQISG